jgi:hypothetical protein
MCICLEEGTAAVTSAGAPGYVRGHAAIVLCGLALTFVQFSLRSGGANPAWSEAKMTRI